jgi:plasmid maintenance system antidote protein VapI
MEMKDPQHPGIFLADELIAPLGLSAPLPRRFWASAARR